MCNTNKQKYTYVFSVRTRRKVTYLFNEHDRKLFHLSYTWYIFYISLECMLRACLLLRIVTRAFLHTHTRTPSTNTRAAAAAAHSSHRIQIQTHTVWRNNTRCAAAILFLCSRWSNNFVVVVFVCFFLISRSCDRK